MSALRTRVRTALALGLPNVLRAVAYRAGVKTGLNPVRRLHARVPGGPFFGPCLLAPVARTPVSDWQRRAKLFGVFEFAVGEEPPSWSTDPVSGKSLADPDRPWWRIPDFDEAFGDIKTLWDLSRMDWVLAFAQRMRNGDEGARRRLERWLEDWCVHNPPYRGPNWKCGQEASIRVLHLAAAAIVLGQDFNGTAALRELVRVHLQRIAPTLLYAMAQDNNHGTSEAAALFIGGSWLAEHGVDGAPRWAAQGRRWLEDRAARLIGEDGSFSQYSLNYHRLMLDTLCLAEVWRRRHALPPFSARFLERARAATEWLRAMIDPSHGDGPNVGANDGAHILKMADTPYRDYRPTVQLAAMLFLEARAFDHGDGIDAASEWLGLDNPAALLPKPASRIADAGGFAVLRAEGALAMLRYPRFRFRPAQADALHVDLWQDGENLLRDAGSYSYNTEARWQRYFSGTEGHNTVQFDGRDQMPRLGRFLFGDWLRTQQIEPLQVRDGVQRFGAAYRDAQGATHRRRIALFADRLEVEDEIGGFAKSAVLRWRLAPGAWRLEGTTLQRDGHSLHVEAAMPIARCALTEGWESRHYFEKTPLPVLEVELHQPGSVRSIYRWKP